MSEILGTHGYIEGCYLDDPTPIPLPGVNLFKWSDKFVNEKRNQVGLVTINIIRGGVTTVTVGTPVVKVFRYDDKYGISQRKEVRDFIINKEHYKFNDVLTQPEQRDIIEEIHDFTKSTLEVGAYNNEPDWKWASTYKLAYAIHTKFIKEEDIIV